MAKAIESRSVECYGSAKLILRKGGLRMNTFFRHHRQRGPVNALQIRLQG
jgi:hypothetical protein